MDPCPFVRIRVGNLALKLPNPQPSSSDSASGSASASFYYCKIRLCNFPLQIATVPVAPDSTSVNSSSSAAAAASFSLSKSDVDAIVLLARKKKKKPGLSLMIDVYGDSNKESKSCGFGFGFGSAKFMGRVRLALDLAEDRITSGLVHNGWVRVGEGKKNNKSGSELYVSVKFDPDPRFVFEFDGEPECSPQVFQVQGGKKQPVFTCKFGFRNSGDRNLRCSSTASEPSTTASCWGTDNHRDHHRHVIKERKGWTVTIHDLSGSPVAVASMVTPFVPSPGSDRVSRSNPGAWLILRPADGTWKPWGRLEAWRDRSSTVSHRFEILSASSGGITLSTGAVNAHSGGKFTIDTTAAFYNSPISSPNSSFDLGSWSGSGSGSGSECGSGSVLGWCGPQWMYKGFVMSSTVGGVKARVEVGAQHVTCTEDAAAFVALAAAVDLSVDACRPFSQKLRKELRQPSEEVVV